MRTTETVPLTIGQNLAALAACRNLSTSDRRMGRALERLSSGRRINGAADDAAGLAVAERLRSQINGMTTAARNAHDGVNVVQIADGALAQTTSILQRMRDLAVQAANGGAQDSAAQGAAQAEFVQLQAQLDGIARNTRFGGQKLLAAGTKGNAAYQGVFQVGADATASERVTLDLSTAIFGPPVPNWTAWWTQADDSAVLKDYSTPPGQPDRSGDVYIGDGTTTAKITLTKDYTHSTTAVVAADIQAQLSGQGVTTLTATVDANNHLVIETVNPGRTDVHVWDGKGAQGFTAGSDIFRSNYPTPTAFDAAGLDLPASGGDVASIASARDARIIIGRIDNTLKYLGMARAKLGAYQNQFERIATNLDVSVENVSAAESAIRDADMAQEAVELTRSRILVQAGTSMLAQANQSPQLLLKLLQG